MRFEWKPTGQAQAQVNARYIRLKHQVTGFIGVFSQFQAISTKAFHAPASKKLPPVSRRRNEKLTCGIELELTRYVEVGLNDIQI